MCYHALARLVNFRLVNCLVINILYLSYGVNAVPAVQSTLPGSSPSGKDVTKTGPLRTGYITDGTTPDKSNFVHYGNAALFYVGDGFFTVIMINPYEKLQAKLTGDTTVNKIADEVKFNLTLMLSFSEVPSGLVRTVRTDSGTVTVDLAGQYPEDDECQFKVLEYLETKDGMPVANYLLLESSLYPDHYLRWYEADGKVDCQPEEKVIPGNDVHFYWKFAVPSTTPVADQLTPIQLQTYDHRVLQFVNKVPQVVKDSVHISLISELVQQYFKLMISALQYFTTA